MVTFQAYRAVMGSFLQKVRSIQRQNYIHQSFAAFIMYCNINLAFLKLLKLCGGDIESNPGPTYSISKVVEASHHQGDKRYGNTAGNQCASNALFSIVYSFLRKVSLWNTFDLDRILFNGDLVCKNLNINNRPLFISDQIDTEKGFINVTLLDNQTAFLTNDNRHNFMKTLLGNHAIGDGLLFMLVEMPILTQVNSQVTSSPIARALILERLLLCYHLSASLSCPGSPQATTITGDIPFSSRGCLKRLFAEIIYKSNYKRVLCLSR